MASKRTCGFLTTPVAKRLKLSKELQQYVNKFLIKPRDYYNYVHGTPPRHKAYTLCLAAIERFDYDLDLMLSSGILTWVQEFAKELSKLERYGVKLSSSSQTISRKSLVLMQLGQLCEWAYTWDQTVIEVFKGL